MFSPNTGESLQDYPLATWPAQNLTRTFNCTRFDPFCLEMIVLIVQPLQFHDSPDGPRGY